jgi:hypothetical protein
MKPFEKLAAALTSAHSDFDLAKIPLPVLQAGVADLASRLQALEVFAAPPHAQPASPTPQQKS